MAITALYFTALLPLEITIACDDGELKQEKWAFMRPSGKHPHL
jgi:hypothetical protein